MQGSKKSTCIVVYPSFCPQNAEMEIKTYNLNKETYKIIKSCNNYLKSLLKALDNVCWTHMHAALLKLDENQNTRLSNLLSKRDYHVERQAIWKLPCSKPNPMRKLGITCKSIKNTTCKSIKVLHVNQSINYLFDIPTFQKVLLSQSKYLR